MLGNKFAIVFGVIPAALPAAAATQHAAPAPDGTPNTLYCMRIEVITGSRIEKVKCWTRQEWADEDVNLDLAWPKDGVRIVADGDASGRSAGS